MPLIITQKGNGQDQSSLSVSNPIDEGKTVIYIANTTHDLKPNTVTRAKYPKSIITGYNSTGFGFQLIFEGTRLSGDRASFISDIILPQIEVFSSSLNPTDGLEAMNDLSKTIIGKAIEINELLDFQISVAITYFKGLKHYCTGFSFNHFGVLLKRTTGEVEHLQGYYHTEVSPNDEIVGCSSLNHKFWGKKFSASIRTITPVNAEESLFYQLISLMKNTQVQGREECTSDSSQDDYFMVGRMVVPTRALCHKIYAHYFIKEMKESIFTFIKRQNNGWNGFLEFFAPNPNVLRAQHYLKLIEESHENVVIGLLIVQLMLHNPKERDLHRYIDGPHINSIMLSSMRTVVHVLLQDLDVPKDELDLLKIEVKKSVENYDRKDVNFTI